VKLYLSQAKAIEAVGPGLFRITQRGSELLSRNLDRITPNLLMDYSEFRNFWGKSGFGPSRKSLATATAEPFETHETPQDSISAAYGELKAAVVRELSNAVQAAPWTFLESLLRN
jgi:restriction endonuclease Mrr